MAKEYHVNFSCDTEQDGAKANISRIQRLMKAGGAELITKSEDDFGGAISITFHYYGNYGDIQKLCNETMEAVMHAPAYVCVNTYEHHPKASIITKDVIEKDLFNNLLETLSTKYNCTNLSPVDNTGSIVEVKFNTSKDTREFINDFTSKAGKYMKNGIDSVDAHYDWEDLQVLDKNNRPINRTTGFTF